MSHSDTIKKIRIAVGAILLVASNAFAETPRAYLNKFDLNDLCIVYPKNHQGFWWARVKDPDGYFHIVTVGFKIGKNYGIITKITNDTVEVIELIQDESTGDYVERTLTLEVACPMIPPCANAPSNDSHIVWLMFKSKLGKEPTFSLNHRPGVREGEKATERRLTIHLGLSVGDRRAWRWVYGGSRGIEPATSEEAKELKEEYGDADLSRFLNDACPTSASNALATTSREYLDTIDLKDLCITYSEDRQGVWVAKVKDPGRLFAYRDRGLPYWKELWAYYKNNQRHCGSS